MKTSPINKSELKNLSFNGFQWFSFNNGIHSFSKKSPKGFMHIQCSDDQLHNGDIEYMAEHELSLGAERIKAIKKKFQASQKS